ncbi:MAG: adenylate/guanylate cyclase domain-containing protein [Balneola sp.]
MGTDFKDNIFFIAKTILFWFFAFLFYDVFRRMGLSQEDGVVLLREPLSRTENLELTLILSFVAGFIYSLIEFGFENQLLKRRGLGVRLLIKTISYFLLINVVVILAIEQLNRFLTVPLEYSYTQLITNGAVHSFIIYFITCSLLFTFFRIVNEKFGKGVLRDMLLGKYRNPRIEKKVFMFVDLKSSTMLAEKMGYIKYSSLIQQCFYDLNEVVRKYDGQIYQYVGDEAVIFWDFDKGIEKNRCIECFFAFRNKLNLKSGFYKKKFQLLPEFKAGIHGGDLIVTEVGVAKKEIAYHGDVINTTARIQEQCSSFEKELLVSGSIYNELKFNGVYSCINLGEVLLKGKQKPIEIYTVQEN